MTSASTDHVLAATRQWLRPVVHVLLRGGITWREFSELAKTVFVEIASTRFGKRGRPTNVSRTSVLTGLSRREVRKQRAKLLAADEPLAGYVTKGCLALATWHLDARFLDANGRPALLPLTGEGATFEALIGTCGGDVRPSTLLKELRSADAVRVLEDGRIEAIKRTYIPHAIDEQLIRLWGTVLTDVATTYVHNLSRVPQTPERFERQAVSDRVDANALPQFSEFLNREGQAFLERVDAWLTQHEINAEEGKPVATVRIGVGMYHIQDG